MNSAGLWLRAMQLWENQSRLLAPGASNGIRPGGGQDAGEAGVVWHRSQVRLLFQMPHRTRRVEARAGLAGEAGSW